MYRIKIIGAGSIGNHFAHASRSRGWHVSLTDVDPEALKRAQQSIYPSRYGAWDEAIVLKDARSAMRDPADIVFVGTPPDAHMEVANQVLDIAPPRALLIEKPLSTPDLDGCQALWERATRQAVFVGVGYNHTLGHNTVVAEDRIRSGKLGAILTISARTREHWGGILRAHPWLAGPEDSYLGFSMRGGGAASEHSHAINIWQHFAHLVGAGKVVEVSATMDIVRDHATNYDRLCLIAMKTEGGLVGDAIQDVVTNPPEKHVRVQGSNGYLDWYVNRTPGADTVIVGEGDQVDERVLPKTRADDFKVEVDHLAAVLEGRVTSSPISLERGLDTMMVIAAAFKSHKEGRRVSIDWAAGYRPEALQ